MNDVCFHLDSRYRDLWAHLVQTYAVPLSYEVGCPEGETTATWLAVDHPDDIVGVRLFLSPLDAKYSPGTVELADVPAEVLAEATLVFGVDDAHNTFVLREGEMIAYVDTPTLAPLNAAQAAVVVLHRLWSA